MNNPVKCFKPFYEVKDLCKRKRRVLKGNLATRGTDKSGNYETKRKT